MGLNSPRSMNRIGTTYWMAFTALLGASTLLFLLQRVEEAPPVPDERTEERSRTPYTPDTLNAPDRASTEDPTIVARRSIENEAHAPDAIELDLERRAMYLRTGLYREVGIMGDITGELDAIAYSDFDKLWRKSIIKRAAGILGSSSWKELATMANLATRTQSKDLPELKVILAEALHVAEQINDASKDALRSGFKTEKWWDTEVHDTSEWQSRNGVGALRGQLGFSSSVAIGGRNYSFYFDSFDYPHIDAAIVDLRRRIVGLEIDGR